MEPKKKWAEQGSRRPELGPTDRDRPEKKTRHLSKRRRGRFGKVVRSKDSHSLVLSKEPMADPAQTPVGTNTSAAKPRRDETPTSAHSYLSGMTNLDAPIITDYSDEEDAGGFRITPESVRSHRAALKAHLEEIEKAEKLKDVQARLTFVENSLTIPTKETAPMDELLTTLLEAIRCRKDPAGKEPVGPA
ncbi:hypothetical protein E3N88_20803 [Mikania micrantha]|uniref:Uncharacterized protein n=1 Tax=Mikania micrantha TaxID=192012 RepID=A0A5N6NJQ9_9ASTR|nr:hypothetical protein E3N88_20803 [Mikania micrantha]